MPRWRANVAGPVLLSRDATTVTVANTTDETTLFTYTVPAGMFGSDHALRLQMGGVLHNSDQDNTDFVFKIKLGATTLWNATITRSNNALELPWRIDIQICQVGGNSQMLVGSMMFSMTTAITTGLGAIAAAPQGGPIYGTASEDEETDLTLAVTVDIGVADADSYVKKFYSVLELL